MRKTEHGQKESVRAGRIESSPLLKASTGWVGSWLLVGQSPARVGQSVGIDGNILSSLSFNDFTFLDCPSAS